MSAISILQNSRNSSFLMPVSWIWKWSSPRGLTADTIEIERVFPVPETTGVFPTGAQVVPAW